MKNRALESSPEPTRSVITSGIAPVHADDKHKVTGHWIWKIRRCQVTTDQSPESRQVKQQIGGATAMAGMGLWV